MINIITKKIKYCILNLLRRRLLGIQAVKINIDYISMSKVYVNEDEIEYDPEWEVYDYAGRTERDIFIPVKKIPGWKHIWKAIVEFDYL